MENRIVKTSIGSFLQMGLLSLSSLVITIFLSRLLTVEEFGIYSLVNALVFFLIIVFTGGIPSSMARFLSITGDRVSRNNVITKGLKILLPWLLICSGLYFLFYKYFIVHIFNEYYFSGLGVIIFLLVLVEVARQLIEKLSHGVSRMSIAAELSAYSALLLIVMSVVAAWLYATAQAVLIAKYLALLLPIPLVLKKLVEVFQQSISTTDPVSVRSKEIISYGIPLSIVSLAAYCFLQADLIFLARYSDATSVGLYSICIFIYMRLTIFPRAIGNGLAPYLARTGYSQDGIAKLELGMSYALMFSVPVTLFFMAESDVFLTLVFGEKYSPVSPILSLLSLYFLMASLLAVLNPILDFSGKASVRAVGVVAGGLVNICLDFIWIPIYHFQGAAWATLAGYFVFFIVVTLNLEKKVLKSLFRSDKIRRIIFVCFIMALIIVVTKYFLPSYSAAMITASFILLYPLLLLFFNVFSIDEIKSTLVRLTR